MLSSNESKEEALEDESSKDDNDDEVIHFSVDVPKLIRKMILYLVYNSKEIFLRIPTGRRLLNLVRFNFFLG